MHGLTASALDTRKFDFEFIFFAFSLAPSQTTRRSSGNVNERLEKYFVYSFLRNRLRRKSGKCAQTKSLYMRDDRSSLKIIESSRRKVNSE